MNEVNVQKQTNMDPSQLSAWRGAWSLTSQLIWRCQKAVSVGRFLHHFIKRVGHVEFILTANGFVRMKGMQP